MGRLAKQQLIENVERALAFYEERERVNPEQNRRKVIAGLKLELERLRRKPVKKETRPREEEQSDIFDS